MDAGQQFERSDWAVSVCLVLMALALYIPFRSQLPYHWDSAEFALAVTDYNIIHSQPHAPGYFLYVMAARLVNQAVGDPHASLVLMSVIAGSLLAPVIYALGLMMFDRRTGLIAALLCMTSPQIWFHSEVALTYIVDGLLVALVVLVCWRAMSNGGRWKDAILIGALLAIVGGVRQQEVIALGPVVFYTFWRFDRDRFIKLMVAAAVALGLGLLWFVPMMQLGGGLTAYLEIVRRHAGFNASATWLGGGWRALVENVFYAGFFSFNGLMLASVVLVATVCYRAFGLSAERKEVWDAAHAFQRQMLIAWVGVMILLATVVGFTKQPGYVLNFLPGLLLVAAVALAQLRKPVMVAATVVICGFNVFTFVAWPRSWDFFLKGAGRTARELREHDERLRTTLAVLRANFQPADTIVLHADEYLDFGLKQFQLLLPEFDEYQLALDSTMLTPPGQPMLAARDGQLRFVAGAPWDHHVMVLVVPPGLTPKIFEKSLDARDAEPVTGSGGTLYRLSFVKPRE